MGGISFMAQPMRKPLLAIMRRFVSRADSLPRLVYHVQWKFRDEARPRFGVMRAREFLMKDGYSFARDEAAALTIYDDVLACYIRSFARLGLRSLAVRAPTGAIGGDLSHEFHVLAKTGESVLFYDKAYDALSWGEGLGRNGYHLDDTALAQLRQLYATTDDLHDDKAAQHAKAELASARGIEVGHIFFLAQNTAKAWGWHSMIKLGGFILRWGLMVLDFRGGGSSDRGAP